MLQSSNIVTCATPFLLVITRFVWGPLLKYCTYIFNPTLQDTFLLCFTDTVIYKLRYYSITSVRVQYTDVFDKIVNTCRCTLESRIKWVLSGVFFFFFEAMKFILDVEGLIWRNVCFHLCYLVWIFCLNIHAWCAPTLSKWNNTVLFGCFCLLCASLCLKKLWAFFQIVYLF